MSVQPLLLRPRRQSREFRVRPLARDYGERKRAREAAKIPLLEGLPGMVKTADEYEAAQAEGQERWIFSFRQLIAANWLKVLRWRRTASPEKRRTFASKWAHLPHTPEYALDLIHSIEEPR